MKMTVPSVGAELHAIMNLMKRNVEYSCADSGKKETELTVMQSRIIGFLLCCSGRDIFQRDLEREFSVQPATASVLLSTMEQKDLIVRESVAQDGRLKKIRLTPKARRLGEIAGRELAHFEEMLVQDIPAEDLAVFFKVTERIKNNLADRLAVKKEPTENEQKQQKEGRERV